MPNFFDKYPYTDFHELNLDWILKTVRELVAEWASTLTEWHNTQEEWQTLYTYVHDYFDNLDVQQEINNKLDQMALDGSLATIAQPIIDAKVAQLLPDEVSNQIGGAVAGQISPVVALQLPGVVDAEMPSIISPIVADWLDDHITQPTTPAIDTSLSIPGAAADAAATGNAITDTLDVLNYATGSELFDPANVTTGYKILSDGNITPDASYFVSDYIEIVPGVTYYKNSPSEDADHRIVYMIFEQASGWPSNNLLVDTANETTAPAKSRYVRFCGLTSEIGSTSFRAKSSSDNVVRNIAGNIYSRTDNLFDISEAVSGVLDSSGNVQPNSSYITSGYIPVYNGQSITIGPQIRQFIAYYYSGYSIAASYVNVLTPNYTYTATTDVFIRFTAYATEAKMMMCCLGSSPKKFEPFGYKTDADLLITKSNILAGKKATSFGDSLMYGHYDALGILDGLCDAEHMAYDKRAVNGAAILNGSIEYQVTSAPADDHVDFIVVDGMMNDTTDPTAYTSALGSLSSSFDPTLLDRATFYGAFEHLLYTLRYKYENANIIFVCCHRTPSRNKDAQDILQAAVRECCNKWAIPYVDIYQQGQINCYFDDMKYDYSYDQPGEDHGGNGTHLTPAGYNKFYAPIIKAKMLELLQ